MSIPIAFVLPDLGGGGAQNVMLQLAGRMQQGPCTPRLLVLGGNQAFAGKLPQGLPVEQGQAQRLRDGLPWLIRRLRALQPRAVVSVMGYLNLALLACRSLLPRSTRIIVREANAIAATTSALPGWLPADWLYRRLYPRADAIISPTQIIADELAALVPAAAERTHVIANPVDIDALRRRASDPRRVPGEGLRLVFVGRLTKQKGLDRLVGILPALPDGAHVSIFGSGPDKESLEQRIEALGQSGRVAFPGFSDNVAPWIAGADALLLPSRWEGLPNVVLESLALGTPVIASDQAGVSELARCVPPPSLTLANVETGFPAAICSLTAVAPPPALRPCLLPESYRADAVTARWQALLADLTTPAHS